MVNAKKEFLLHKFGNDIKCAVVKDVADETIAKLCVGYSELDYNTFISALDFDYDNGYGTQYLYGIIFYQDNTWSERNEYDGSEWWVHRECPAIPEELL